MSVVKPLIASFWLHCFLLVLLFHFPEPSPVSPATLSQQPSLVAANADTVLAELMPPRVLKEPPVVVNDSGAYGSLLFDRWADQVHHHWRFPLGLKAEKQGQLLLRLSSQGNVESVAVTQSSGSLEWDRLLRQAVYEASPLDLISAPSLLPDQRTVLIRVSPFRIQSLSFVDQG